MSAFLEFGGQRVHVGAITIPFTGLWVADLTFADVNEIATTDVLSVGDLSLRGTVFRQAVFAGQRTARVVGGFGGWLKSLPARAYALPGGVRVKMVLGDAAAEAGEQLSVATDSVIGDYFIREAAEGQRVLRQLAGLGWFVDTAGVTQVRARPAATILGDYLVQSYDGARGEFVISTESYAEWQPGNTFENALVTSPQTVGMVRIESDNDGTLRHTILTVGPEGDADRMLGPIRALIRSEVPALTFLGTYSYIVVESTDTVATCRPENPGTLPAVVKVPLRNGVAGMQATPASGARIALVFLDGDPSRPRMMGGLEPAGTARAVVCYGDTVNAGAGEVVISPGTVQTIELAGLPVTVKAQRLHT